MHRLKILFGIQALLPLDSLTQLLIGFRHRYGANPCHRCKRPLFRVPFASGERVHAKPDAPHKAFVLDPGPADHRLRASTDGPYSANSFTLLPSTKLEYTARRS